MGICPAASDRSFDGVNRGKNAGRICWAVTGTLCGGKVQGTFAEKRCSCVDCDFFNLVRAEEGTANLRTKFLRFVSYDAESPLFNSMTYRHVRAGERFIRQGESGDEAYIVERGSCLVIVEKNGKLFPVGHRGEGDIVGIMALLTGEPRGSHVEAETEMDMWVLNRDRLDRISREDPEMLCFLTELVAARFDSGRPVADRKIGKYIATDIIGRGAYSIVYKGKHMDLDMPVVIKMMRHDMAMNPDFQTGFRNEAKTIAGLHHENIVRVYDIEEGYKTVFIIAEYLEGESLKSMIERLKTIPPSLAADYVKQICLGLECAHAGGIIHRDINPANIFILKDDRLKILDFGLCCQAGTADPDLAGTVFYMAPEQVEGCTVDPRTDIYALGITTYEMVTGRRPFQDKNLTAVMDMHLSSDIPDPWSTVPELPEPLRRFILKACRRNPHERFQNMGEALRVLEPLRAQSRPAGTTPVSEERKITTLRLIYDRTQQHDLDRLMEEFAGRMRDLGAELHVAGDLNE